MGHFQDELHAVKTGVLVGNLLRAGIRVNIEADDEGNYLDEVTLYFPDEDDEFVVRIKVLP